MILTLMQAGLLGIRPQLFRPARECFELEDFCRFYQRCPFKSSSCHVQPGYLYLLSHPYCLKSEGEVLLPLIYISD